jgi:hypothetical protein
MTTIIYRLLAAIVCGLIVREIFAEEDSKAQLLAALSLIPFAMRALMIA